MIKKTFLSKIKKDLNLYQKERGVIINQSRKILQNSKKAIFALHREDKVQARESLKDAEIILKKLNQTYNKANRLRFEGSYKAAVEEYVEAKTFSLVLIGKSLDKINIESIGPEEYINGLADLTGELVRQAVLQVTKGNFQVIEKYKIFTEEIVEFLLTLYLTGASRQKSDDAKRNLKRLEQILYDLKIKKL
jgi:predicted translin family RNA/ssDNA-binding protein